MSAMTFSGPLLRHPATLVMLSLWGLNDHLFKAQCPGVLSGKLSDVAAMVVLPAVFLGAAEWAFPGNVRLRPRRFLFGSVALAGLVLVALNTSLVFDQLYEYGVGAVQYPVRALVRGVTTASLQPFEPVTNTVDVPDLMCLPALFIPLWLSGFARKKAREPCDSAAQDPR